MKVTVVEGSAAFLGLEDRTWRKGSCRTRGYSTRCPAWGAMGSSLPADAVNDYKLDLVM